MVSGVRADIAVKVFGDDLEQLVHEGQRGGRVIRRACPGGADVAVEQVGGPADPEDRRQAGRDRPLRHLGPGRARHRRERRRQGRGADRGGAVAVSDRRAAARGRCGRARGDRRHRRSRPGRRERAARADRRRSRRSSGPKFVTREWSERRVVVQCNVRGRDVGGFVAEAQGRDRRPVDLPAGQFRLEWGGQFENMQRAQKRLAIVVPLALLLIIALLYLTYRNVADTAPALRERAVRLRGRHLGAGGFRGDAALDLGGGGLHHALGRVGAQRHGGGQRPPRAAGPRHGPRRGDRGDGRRPRSARSS